MSLFPLAYYLTDLVSIGYLLMGYYLWREWSTYYHTAFYSSVSMSIPILRRVWQLKACLQRGLISEAEFKRQKAELLSEGSFVYSGLDSVPVTDIPIGLRLIRWLVGKH
jgi:hypothetical protein